MAKYLAIFGILLALSRPAWTTVECVPCHMGQRAQVLSGPLDHQPVVARSQHEAERFAPGERAMSLLGVEALVPPADTDCTPLDAPLHCTPPLPSLQQLHVRLQP